MDNNLVNLTDEELDGIVGAGLPKWMPILISAFGEYVRDVWDMGGSKAVYQYCIQRLSVNSSVCKLVGAEIENPG